MPWCPHLLLAASLCACAYQPLENPDVEVRTLRLGRSVTLVGIVIHQLSEAPLANVHITVSCDGWQANRTLRTDANGEFRLRRLGKYCSVCARDGTDAVGSGYFVRPGQRVRMTIRLLPTRNLGNPLDCSGPPLILLPSRLAGARHLPNDKRVADNVHTEVQASHDI